MTDPLGPTDTRNARGGAATDQPTERPERAESATVLVGIPAFNEAGTIAEVVTAARGYADEVLVVDDGSDDDTLERARAAGASVSVHEENQGYGASLRTIFRYAHVRGFDHLVVVDADGQHDVNDIPELVRAQQEREAAIVTGTRFGGESLSEIPRYRRVGLAVINLLTNLGLSVGYGHPPVSDTQCGFRAYDADAVATLATAQDIGSGMGASLDIIFRAAREGYDIVEVPTRIDYDVEDANTQNPVVQGLDLLRSLFLAVARDRPVRTGSAMLGVGLLSGVAALALLQLGLVAMLFLLPVLLVFAHLMSVTFLRSPLRRSDRTDNR